jgi:hypothetical protein
MNSMPVLIVIAGLALVCALALSTVPANWHSARLRCANAVEICQRVAAL